MIKQVTVSRESKKDCEREKRGNEERGRQGRIAFSKEREERNPAPRERGLRWTDK